MDREYADCALPSAGPAAGQKIPTPFLAGLKFGVTGVLMKNLAGVPVF